MVEEYYWRFALNELILKVISESDNVDRTPLYWRLYNSIVHRPGVRRFLKMLYFEVLLSRKICSWNLMIDFSLACMSAFFFLERSPCHDSIHTLRSEFTILFHLLDVLDFIGGVTVVGDIGMVYILQL